MELLLIPVLLVTGAALLHIGINGAPPVPHFAPILQPGMSFSSLRSTATRTSPARGLDLLNPDSMPEGLNPEAVERAGTLELSDVLLAELLSEMMMFRRELAELREQVVSATAAARSMSTPTEAPAPAPARKSSPRSGRTAKATA